MNVVVTMLNTQAERIKPLQWVIDNLASHDVGRDLELEVTRGDEPHVTLAEGDQVRLTYAPILPELVLLPDPQVFEVNGYIAVPMYVSVKVRASSSVEAERLVGTMFNRTPANLDRMIDIDYSIEDLYERVNEASNSRNPALMMGAGFETESTAAISGPSA